MSMVQSSGSQVKNLKKQKLDKRIEKLYGVFEEGLNYV